MAGQAGQCTLAGVQLAVVTWNLWHGRSQAGAGGDRFDEFAAILGSWEWDIALLQEVPPWWPDRFARRLDVAAYRVLTSRNAGLFLRRALAVRWPDVMRSNGGGSNAILLRGRAAAEHRVCRLSFLPERRWVHAVRLDSLWVANLHTEASVDQVRAAAATVVDWAGSSPAVLGGDFNLRSVSLPGFAWAGGAGVDHVLVSGSPAPAASFEVLGRGALSDHAPVLTRIAWP
jgi:endonuclease/exonuclease/phosphatase family metal-dependent hydrolase